jgi:hypothetical protein
MDVRGSNLTPCCHISLPYITKFVSNANHPRGQPHTFALCCVSTCGVAPSHSHSSSSYATCWMLVNAYATSPGKAKWMDRTSIGDGRTNSNCLYISFVLNVTCCTKFIVSCIRVYTIKLRNITCALVATCVILRRLGCIPVFSNLGPVTNIFLQVKISSSF